LAVALQEKTQAVSAEVLCQQQLKQKDAQLAHLTKEVERLASDVAVVSYERDKLDKAKMDLERNLNLVAADQKKTQNILASNLEKQAVASSAHKGLVDENARLVQENHRLEKENKDQGMHNVVLYDQLAGAKRMLDETEERLQAEKATLESKVAALSAELNSAKVRASAT
jgi:chromosome segregation ATPase